MSHLTALADMNTFYMLLLIIVVAVVMVLLSTLIAGSTVQAVSK